MAKLTPVDHDPFAAPTGPTLTPVDHDPFAAPAAAPSEIAQPGDSLGNMGWFDPRAANATTKDFLLAHLSELGKGLGQMGQAGADYARVAANTYGEGDSTLASMKALYGDITGNTKGTDILSNLAAAKGDTAAASERLGTAGTIAANLTGGGPLGEVAGAVKGMLPAAGRFAGPLAGAITGAGATTAGEIGRNEALSPWDIGIGTVTGGVGGAPAGKGGVVAPALSEDALRAAAKTAYAPLDAIVFHGPTQVKPALDTVTRTMTDAEQDLAKSTMAKVNKLGGVTDPNTGVVKGGVGFATGSDLQSYQKIFGDLAQSGSGEDRQFAPKFKAALEDVMQNTTPVGRNVTPGQGMSFMPPGSMGAPGFAAGEAAAARDAGNVPYGRANDIKRLNDWIDKSQIAGGGAGTDVGSQASSYLRSPPGQRYAPPRSPQYDALNTLASTAAKESSIPWWVKHFVIAPAAGTIINEGVQAGTGEHESPLEHLGADLGIGAVLAGSMAGYGKISGMRARAAQQHAIDAARSTLSTGNFQAPIAPDQPFRDAVRRLIFSQGAAGRIPGQ